MNSQIIFQVLGGKIYNTVYPADSTQNFAAGAQDIINKITTTLSSSPDECFILQGYSQGAAATVNALHNLTGASFDAVKGVFLIGDPNHKSGLACNIDNNGGDTTKNVDGLLVALEKEVPDEWISKTSDVCIFVLNTASYNMEVETLIPQLQDTLSKISIAVNELSAKAQYDELDQLEQKREHLLADLQTSFEKEIQESETKRQKELEDIKKKRKQEDEERAARRQREDEELQKAKSKEDKKRQRKHDNEVDSIEDETERKMDEIEEVAQRAAQEGKKKLEDLEGKRRELNRRIDEQLTQSLPTVPSRGRHRPRKESGDHPTDNIEGGDSSSAGPPNKDSNPKKKLDTSSKPQSSPSTNLREKSPEAKNDGEVPFQDRTIGPPQAVKNHVKNLPKSFAEVLKNNMSNISKGKPELGRNNPDQAVRKQAGRGEHDSDQPSTQQGETSFTGMIANILTGMGGMSASGGGFLPTKVKPIAKDEEVIGNTESLPDVTPEFIRSQDQDDAELSYRKLDWPAPAVCNAEESKRDTENERQKAQLRNAKVETGLKKPSRSPPIYEPPKELESAPRGNRTLIQTTGAEVNPVDSAATVQSPRLSSTSDKRSPGQSSKTRSEMELEQPEIPDLLEQKQPRDSRSSFGNLTRSQTPSHSFQNPAELVFSAPPSPIQGDLVLSLNDEVFDISPERGTPIGFEDIQDLHSEYLHIIGQQAQAKCASPLPVENETVRGQDQLFDDNKSLSDISEPDISEGESDSSPNIPIRRQGLPVLLEPHSQTRLDDEGLTTLIGEFDSWAILTEQITGRRNEDHSRFVSSNFPPAQESGDLTRLDTRTKSESDISQDDSHGKPRPKVNINGRPTDHASSPLRHNSPIRHPPQEPEQIQSAGRSQVTECIDDQGAILYNTRAHSHLTTSTKRTLSIYVMAKGKSLALITGGILLITLDNHGDALSNNPAPANSGIGFEVANQLLADGSFHVLLGARSIEKGQAALVELQSRNLPGTVDLVRLDVADENSVAAAAKLVEEKHGRLDALVNNAAIAGSDGTIAQQMIECFRVSAVGAQLMGDYFAPLLKKSGGTPRIVNVTSGAGSITNRMDPNGYGNEFQVIPYRVSKTAMNMVFACQHRGFESDGFKVFLYGPGPTVSNLTPGNSGHQMKPTSVGAAPIVEMVQGKRDADAGTYIEYGKGVFPW
ncbi:hypothetical protein GQX73_g2919 [Xylaria multiplex]|uniref:Cutinase n=1 Tax=Xylaria multiplex TaxID=323545 RepID=A0A7C8IRU5_9PEZI|nr:hypothetical protein GQX73_g2919 [Xylaria multiplex]